MRLTAHEIDQLLQAHLPYLLCHIPAIVDIIRQARDVRDRAKPKTPNAGAQAGLDCVLRKLLPTDPVVYVDVGAAEPIECSNTWQFYEAGGHGLLIEPLPFCWYPLLLQRHRDCLWPRAVASSNGWARFHVCGTCSSLDPAWTTEKRGTLMVETERLDEILDRFPQIADEASLCSIDVEGTEEDVVADTDWELFRPRILVVEYKSFEHPETSDSRAKAIVSALRVYAEVYRDEFNLVMRRKGT